MAVRFTMTGTSRTWSTKKLQTRMGTLTTTDFADPTIEELSAWLLKEIPKEQVEAVFARECDIGPEFVGFVKTYWHLSKIIPKDYVVYDFGAAYNFQSWFFREHKSYFAIEPSYGEIWMIRPDNCLCYPFDTAAFLKYHTQIPDKSFAIVNCVPSWYNQDPMELVKSRFRNVYTFYPSLDYEDDKTIYRRARRETPSVGRGESALLF